MKQQVLEDVLDNLAVRFIPDTKHKVLHVNSRRAWKDLMITLLQDKEEPLKMSFLCACARQWEMLLYQKISILN